MVIKSTSYDNDEILRAIMSLYCPEGFDLDPTYGKGFFYKEIKKPTHRFDIRPQTPDTVQARAEALPLGDASVRSAVFDPPFLAGYTKGKATGKIGGRFDGFASVSDLWDWYEDALSELHRVLEPEGILAFKCQDTVSSGKNYLSHVHIINHATTVGFYPRDLFVLLAKNRMIGHNHKNQKHARKFHCYWLVFEKRKSRVDYRINS